LIQQFPRRLSRGAAGAGIAVVVMATAFLTGCSTKHQPSYGSLPTYLPTASFQPDRILTGSTARPALTTEGDSVRVQLPKGTVLVTVTGPEVPGEGLPYQTDATTCTWTITLTQATAQLPINVADFTTVDHLGTIYHPSPVVGQPAPPTAIAPKQTVSFELRAVMVTGEGLMRWAPGAPQIVASWDFEVETD
jgi:hypothetical protein